MYWMIATIVTTTMPNPSGNQSAAAPVHSSELEIT